MTLNPHELVILDDLVVESNPISFTPKPLLDLDSLENLSGIPDTFITKHKVKLEYGVSDEAIDDFAADHALEIVLPGKNEILVDLDATSSDKFDEQLEILQQTY